jgi:hypothetical protein
LFSPLAVETPCRAALRSFPSSTQMSDRGGDELEGKEKEKGKEKKRKQRACFFIVCVFFFVLVLLVLKPD